MKTVIALILFAGMMFAQQQPEMVTVPKSALSPQQIAAAEFEASKAKAAQYGEWVGIGKEVGVAVDSSLSAISNRADEFAHTSVGKWTIAIVVFKVVGIQAMQFILGVGILIVGLPLLVYAWRKNCLPQRIVTEESEQDGKKTRKWKVINENNYGDSVGYILGGFVLALFACAVIFIH